MPPPRRFRAPAENGAVLADPDFDRVPELVERNRRILDTADVVIGGLPLRELRALARREVLDAAREYTQRPGTFAPGLSSDAPLILAGHQPELAHPGVWVKHFALNGLARKLGGVSLNLVVDNDTVKSTSLRVPVFDRDPAGVHLQAIPFDRFDGEEPYEGRGIHDAECFRTFAERAAPLWKAWGIEPLLPRVWKDVVDDPAPTIGGKFAAARRKWEREWGCENLELPVSWFLPPLHSFGWFVSCILIDLDRFRAVYNNAVRDYRQRHGITSNAHPVPDLAMNGEWLEAPFWQWRHGSRRQPMHVRKRAFAPGYATLDTKDDDPDYVFIRPRALTLTLFARLCLGDFFIHGIGGGKYDEVTDAIIRDYFGLEPPAYQVLSATLHLPLPTFPDAEARVTALTRYLRHAHWNPQRRIPGPDSDRPEVRALLARHQELIEHEPPDSAGRRARFREFRRIKDELRPLNATAVARAKEQLTRAQQEVRANAILRRRDYSWVLYPEEVLRPFLQRFLEE